MKEIVVTRAELAHCLDPSENRIAQLLSSGVLPSPKARGKYSLPTSMLAYLRYIRSNQSTLAAERTRLTKARADYAELELRVRAKELIEVAKVEKHAFDIGRQVRDAILSAPDRIAGIVSAELIKAGFTRLFTKNCTRRL